MHIVVHNCRTQHSTQQFDNIPTFPPDNHHSSDAVYGRRGGFAAVPSRTPRRASSQLMTSERKPILLQLTAQQSVLIARPSIYWCSTHIFALTFDHGIRPWLWVTDDRARPMINWSWSMQAKNQGRRSGVSNVRVQTNKGTDTTDFITFPANAVVKLSN